MSFIPKKVKPFRVRVTSGRFLGASGMAVDRYDDGVFGIDTDDGRRAFATEEQFDSSSIPAAARQHPLGNEAGINTNKGEE